MYPRFTEHSKKEMGGREEFSRSQTTDTKTPYAKVINPDS